MHVSEIIEMKRIFKKIGLLLVSVHFRNSNKDKFAPIHLETMQVQLKNFH